ncbi:DUF6599 family protein [Thermodesulfobacteriota bacterium]
MPKARVLLILPFGFLLAGMVFANADTKPEGGLLWILPDLADGKALKPEDGPQQAKSDDLYELINGGASVYLKNGFKQALLQDYRSSNGTLFNLEVYELDSSANAKKVFALNGGNPAKKGTIGQGSNLEDYYGLFWQGSFFITVTASETTPEAKGHLKQIAKAVVKKIKDKNKPTPE